MPFWLILLIIVAYLTAVIGLVFVTWTFILLIRVKAPFVKTPTKSIRTLLVELLLSPADTVVDLGCGDGTVLIEIEKHAGARCVGFELSPIAYFQARRSITKNHSRVKVRFSDFRKQNLSRATVIFCFLIHGIMSDVGALLE